MENLTFHYSIEAHWHIGMSSASYTGNSGVLGFRSRQGRVIFHHKFLREDPISNHFIALIPFNTQHEIIEAQPVNFH